MRCIKPKPDPDELWTSSIAHFKALYKKNMIDIVILKVLTEFRTNVDFKEEDELQMVKTKIDPD